MRVTTLKARCGGVGAIVRYYTQLGAERSRPGGHAARYYVDPDEPPGRWWGAGRHAVGLDGEVSAGALARMLDGRDPHSDARLGRRYGERSARGFDATFSAPKSVSVLWALSPDERVRSEILAAHDTAVETALAWLEQHGCVTRRGRDGVDQVDAVGLTVALFRQHTSRSVDPQLHTHAVVLAKVQNPTGAWLALDARFLLRQQRSISWIYDAALRSELTRRLGVRWEPVPSGAGQSDLAAVPAGLRDVFSQRTGQVDAKLAELIGRWSADHDGAEPDPRTIWVLQRRAVLVSRPTKEHATKHDPEQDLQRDRWRDRSHAAGFDPDHVVPDVSQLPHSNWPLDSEAIIAEALERVSEQSSTWLQADLAREIAALIPPTAADGADALIRLVDDLAAEAAGRCIELHPPAQGPMPCRRDGQPLSEHVTDRALTIGRVLSQEQWLADWADIRHEPAPANPPADSQQTVADAVAGWGRLVLVVGPAGTGKTTAIRAGVTELGRRRRPVLGLAPSGKAADVLAETAGCEAITLASLLHRHHHGMEVPKAGTTIILDEASMASSDDLDMLVTLTERCRWRLICVGDPEQLPAVGRGGMFAHWCDTLTPHRLERVHRFHEGWQAEASLALRRGEPAAVEIYQRHQRIHPVHPALLPGRVADRYLRRAEHGDSVAITAASSATARAINVEIQARTRQGEPPGAAVALVDGTEARVGDRIATRRNDRRLVTETGAPVRNRHTWDVLAVAPDGAITAHHPDRGTVTLPSGYVARHVELGWAVTGYGSQGITTDDAICVVEPSSTRAGIYVGLTRGRGDNTAFVADPTGLADPADDLAAAIARPANTITALATRNRLYEAQGLEAPEREDQAPALAGLVNPSRPLGDDQPQLDPPEASLERIQQHLETTQQRAARRDLSRGLSL